MSDETDHRNPRVGSGIDPGVGADVDVDVDAAERERIVDLLEAIDRALARADDVRRMALGLRCERDSLVARLRRVCGGSIH